MRYEGDDGASMWVEAALQPRSDVGLVADDSGATKALTRLEDSLESVRGAGVALLRTISDLRQRSEGGLELDEVTLDLALAFGVEGGVIVAKGSAQAEASVALTWRAGSGG